MMHSFTDSVKNSTVKPLQKRIYVYKTGYVVSFITTRKKVLY